MKTQTWKKLKGLAILSIVAAMSVSCGSKKNKAEQNQDPAVAPVINPGTYIPVAGQGPQTAEMSSKISQFSAQTSCTQQAGVRREITFNTMNRNGSNLMPPFNYGVANGGSPLQAYVGKSYFGDIISVVKVSMNGQIAYNITLSYCYYTDHQSYGSPVLMGPNTVIEQQFYAQSITLDDNGPLGLGRVVAAIKTSIIVNNTPQNLNQFGGQQMSISPIRSSFQTSFYCRNFNSQSCL